MSTVLIIDDEADARTLIRQYLSPYEGYEIIGECENGPEAVMMINKLEPDLVFLDIQMPGLSGFQVVQQLVHIPQIIFSTAYDQYAVKAFDTNAIDYLLKPYTAERFKRAIAKVSPPTAAEFTRTQKMAEEITGQHPTCILVEGGNKLVNINVDDIIYFEAEKDYTRIHTEVKSYLSNFGIGILEQRMDNRQFLRIHRSYIVNISGIKEVYRDGHSVQVILKTGKSLNVSRTYLDDLKKLFY